MKKINNISHRIKNFISPDFLNKLQYVKAYATFLPYKKILNKNNAYKDIHKGKRCFILGSGKSLDYENIRTLQNEIIIGVNSFVYHHDFNEIANSSVEKYFFSAPIHGPYKEEHWKNNFEMIESILPKNVVNIFGINNYEPNIKHIIEKYNIFDNRKIIWYLSNIPNTSSIYKAKKSDLDLSSNIWTSNTGSILALISALYMGFDKIYLLGMDHDYFLHDVGDSRFNKINKNISILEEEINVIKETRTPLRSTFQDQADIFLQYERLNNIFPNKIFNLGKKSMLDVFPCENLSEVLSR
jgi:hypothetical protein